MNIVTGIVLPVGLFFYFRMIRFRLRLYRDLKVINRANTAIVKRIDEHFLHRTHNTNI